MHLVRLIVVSDTVSKDSSTDKAASTLEKFLESYASYKLQSVVYVPDEMKEIENAILEVTEPGTLILTSGGTGFAERDVTPEAVSQLIEKPASGLVHAMMSKSLEVTAFGALARLVAGSIGKSLILTLPGKPKAIVEILDGLMDILGHALDLLAGADSRRLHGAAGSSKNIEHSHTHSRNNHAHFHSHSHSNTHSQSHSHSHKGHGPTFHRLITNDLAGPITARARESPFPMTPVRDALEIIKNQTGRLEKVELSVLDKGLVGSIVTNDILSEVNVPEFRASIVDGYAVVHTDGPGVYLLASVSHAAPSTDDSILKKGTIARVTTGAPIPLGATAVVPVEETRINELTEQGNEELRVEVLAEDVQEGDNVRDIGSDVKKGDCILKEGTVISNSGGELGLLISAGIQKVYVYRKPKIGVLSTGDELKDVKIGSGLEYGQIFDSNRHSLISVLENLGFEVVDLGIAKDKPGTLESLMKDAYAVSKVDMLISTGGVSMGELDLLKPTIERKLKGQIHFGRVNMKPGKPSTFATFEPHTFGDHDEKKYIFALPGNPASALVTFYLFVYPALKRLSGFGYTTEDDSCYLPSLPCIEVRLEHAIKLDSRPEYHRARVKLVLGKEYWAESTGNQRSSKVGSVKGANALLCLPSSKDGPSEVASGKTVKALLIGQIEIFDNYLFV